MGQRELRGWQGHRLAPGGDERKEAGRILDDLNRKGEARLPQQPAVAIACPGTVRQAADRGMGVAGLAASLDYELCSDRMTQPCVEIGRQLYDGLIAIEGPVIEPTQVKPGRFRRKRARLRSASAGRAKDIEIAVRIRAR
jgi:hypothetical protein